MNAKVELGRFTGGERDGLHWQRGQPLQVLLIEDDSDVSTLISKALIKHGYQVDLCEDGEAGLLAALTGRYQIILLDVMLPSLDGLSLLSRLRSGGKETPVILLSALGEEQDRINGFHSGADDYLPKPFSLQELQLRIEVLLKRCYAKPAIDDLSSITEDPLKLCRKDKRVEVKVEENKWQSVETTPVEFELLWQLLKSKEDVLSRPYLYQVVLNRAFSRYDRSLDMHISNLRQKLKQCLPYEGLIKTIRGQGYRYR